MIGIIGDIGPLATVYFMEMVIKKTVADEDQDHIDMIVMHHPTIADKINGILSENKMELPIEMIEDVKKLQKLGVSFIVVPFNATNYIYEKIRESVKIDTINIIEETVLYIKNKLPKTKKIGLLTTTDTIKVGSYQQMCEKYNLKWEIPNPSEQNQLMNIINDQVKLNKKINVDKLINIIKTMRKRECSVIILGCTELSIIKEDFDLDDEEIIDALSVLADKTVIKSGKKLKKKFAAGTPKEFTDGRTYFNIQVNK